MSSTNDINDAIARNATGPKKVQVGNQSVEQHPVADQIAAANHQAATQAAIQPGLGLRFRQITPVYR